MITRIAIRCLAVFSFNNSVIIHRQTQTDRQTNRQTDRKET